MKALSALAAVAGLASVLTFFPAQPAAASSEVGILRCETVADSRTNYLVRSTADVTCVFENRAATTENYIGETGIAVGLTLTFKQTAEQLRYAVAASTTTVEPGALNGKFVGAQADVAVKKGAGGAILVGGGNDQISLSPMGLTQGGYGASAGVGFLHLQAVK